MEIKTRKEIAKEFSSLHHMACNNLRGQSQIAFIDNLENERYAKVNDVLNFIQRIKEMKVDAEDLIKELQKGQNKK